MPDIWIGFNSADRRRYWWRAGISALVFAGVLVWTGLTVPASGARLWVGACVVLFMAVVLSWINLIYGRVLLTAEGLEFRTFVRRRSVPWSEVAGVERRQRVSRSGTWTELRVTRVGRRPLVIPGTVTKRRKDAELDRKQAVIEERWSRAAGG
ncbi:PH domain-containing protein [Streptomyces mangrovisoli]|uniref:Low molecular weight protein antigen 6 PH domain-containing protein n=1 Tax=Streptomyces mangrovisoli TaxID=1428628 RepID=A0A1J4NNU2_9ACTN|nr:PH domain-containing protein [Streptomyces mangrovisoli]OIJ64023.1 hypothetical protein WN71_031615 [Streptomyces mangrovisoli]